MSLKINGENATAFTVNGEAVKVGICNGEVFWRSPYKSTALCVENNKTYEGSANKTVTLSSKGDAQDIENGYLVYMAELKQSFESEFDLISYESIRTEFKFSIPEANVYVMLEFLSEADGTDRRQTGKLYAGITENYEYQVKVNDSLDSFTVPETIKLGILLSPDSNMGRVYYQLGSGAKTLIDYFKNPLRSLNIFTTASSQAKLNIYFDKNCGSLDKMTITFNVYSG